MQIARSSLIVLLLCLACCVSHAATLYMGSGETYTNLQAAMAAMEAGDTLIIRDGTYTGSSNSITSTARPPRGSAWTEGNYSIIRAETDGGVIFDGENTNKMFSSGPSAESWYVKFQGIEWKKCPSSATILQNVSHVKFIRCGFADAGSGNTSLFRLHDNCSYILVEECWAYGGGRYKFSCHLADHIIFRTCVARYDRHDNAGTYNPVGNFCSYSSSYVLFQNCISIDSDQQDYVLDTEYSDGSYIFPTTAGASTGNAVTNCLAINDDFMGLVVTGYCSNLSVTNSVFVDNKPILGRTYGNGTSEELYGLRGINTVINHCTMIDGYSPTRILNMSDASASSSTSVKNSVLTRLLGTTTFIYDFSAGRDVEDYNCLYGNGGSGVGAHDITVDPLYHASTNTTGGIKYPVRVESDSNLSGQGESGATIGANCMTLIGTPESMYDEDGYATDTEVSMWPYPNEDLIKTKLAAYTWDDGSGGDPEITGARGFCATGKQLNGTDDITLTSYIWEYLGNEIPSDIYGTSTVTSTASGTANWR